LELFGMPNMGPERVKSATADIYLAKTSRSADFSHFDVHKGHCAGAQSIQRLALMVGPGGHEGAKNIRFSADQLPKSLVLHFRGMGINGQLKMGTVAPELLPSLTVNLQDLLA
jgi:hypothetical protein